MMHISTLVISQTLCEIKKKISRDFKIINVLWIDSKYVCYDEENS
jgi:hypothetical protein